MNLKLSANLKLDFSNMPPTPQPTPTSNTLLITNLQNPDIFRPDNLQSIRDLIQSIAPIHTWAPLKSFRRIVVSFYDEQAAVRVRSIWDGEAIMGHRTRVYFGVHTPLDAPRLDHLALPDAERLFFISPPPSPPRDWEIRLEDAPNRMVHAEDLAAALAKLRTAAVPYDLDSPVSPSSEAPNDASCTKGRRSRSSTLIYHPEAHGSSLSLPAIAVEDLTDETEEQVGEPEQSSLSTSTKPMVHTARPPVELM